MKQETLGEKTGPLPKQRRKTTVTNQSKAVEEREIYSDLELTNKDTSKQFEESEKVTLANKNNLNHFKQTVKEHATDEKMLAKDDEADAFQSFGSTPDRYWKRINIFSKQG